MATPSLEEFIGTLRQDAGYDYYSDNELTAHWQENFAEKYEVENTGDFKAGVKGGIASLGALVDSGQAFLGDVVGADEFRDNNLEEARLGFEEAAKWGQGRPVQLEDIEGIGDAVDYVQYTLGSLAPSAAESVLAGAVGAFVGGATATIPGAAAGLVTGLAKRTAAKNLAKRFVEQGIEKNVAEATAQRALDGYLKGEVKDDLVEQAYRQGRKTAGAAIALTANEYGMGVAESYNTTVEAGEASPGKAALAAIPYAAAGVVPEAVLAGRVLNRVPGKESVAGAAGKGLLQQGAMEGSAEALQELTQIKLEESVSGEPVDDMGSRLLNAGVAGAVGGGVLGGAVSGMQAAAGKQIDPIEELARNTRDQIQAEARQTIASAELTVPDVSMEAEALNLDQLADANRYLGVLDEQTKLVEIDLADKQRKQQERDKANAELRKREDQLDDEYAQGVERTELLGDIREGVRERREKVRPTINNLAQASTEQRQFRESFTDTDTLVKQREPEVAPEPANPALAQAFTQALNKAGKSTTDVIARFETDVTKRDGSPFKTEAEARVSARSKTNRGKNLTPVQVNGGWVLHDPENVKRARLPLLPAEQPANITTKNGVTLTDSQLREEAQRRRDIGLTPDVIDAQNKKSATVNTDVDQQLAELLKVAVAEDAVTQSAQVNPVDLPSVEKAAKPFYKDNVASLADSLVKGGNVGYLRDENDKIIGRTGSENPEWFKQMAEVVPNASTTYVKSTVKKLQDQGYESLTAKQKNVVDYLIGVVDSDMEANASPEEIQRLVDDYTNLGDAPETTVLATDSATDGTNPDEAPNSADTSKEEGVAGAVRPVQGQTARTTDSDGTGIQDQEDTTDEIPWDEPGKQLTDEEADALFGVEKNDLTESRVSDDLNAGQADLQATPEIVEPAQNQVSESENSEQNQRVSESESISVNSMDQFDEFIATADPEVSYEITWPDGKTTKIRNIENSIPRLEKIAEKMFRDESIRTQGEAVEVTQDEIDNGPVIDPEDEAQVITEEPEGFYSTKRKANGDPTDAEATKVADAVRDKGMIEATEWLIENAPVESYRLIAARVLDRLKKLQSAGITLKPIRLIENNTVRVNGSGVTTSDVKFDRSTAKLLPEQTSVEILLNGPDVTGYVGTNYETLLHELLHAALDSSVYYGSLDSSIGTDLRNQVSDLYKVFNDSVGEYNRRYRDGSLDEKFKSFAERTNAFKDPHELISWGLTNGEFQQFLMTIKVEGGQSLWTRFVETIRNFLGMGADMDNALGQLLRVSDQLLSSDVNGMIGGNSHRIVSNMLARNAFFGTQTSGNGSFGITPETRELIEKRGVRARDKMRTWFKRYFQYAGNADRETANLKIMTDAEKNAGQKELQGMIADFKRDATKAFNVKDFYDIPEARRDAMNAYLSGQAVTLPKSVTARLDVMRDYLDMWSDNMITALGEQFLDQIGKLDERTQRKFYDDGEVPANMMGLLELRELIESNKGTYLNRSFRIFQEGSAYMDEVLENTDLINRAKAEIQEDNLYRTAAKAIGARANDREAKINAAAEYLRTDKASSLLTAQQIGRLDVLRDQLLTDSELEGAVKHLLKEAADSGDMSSMIAQGRMYGSKDVSILKKRDNSISPTMLELLGEYKDPGVNFVNSATKMQSYVANHNFLHSLYVNGRGKFIMPRAETINGVDYIAEIKGTNTLNPLNGMFVTPEFEQAMRDMQGGFDSSKLMNQIIRYNSMVKYGKTVLSPTTQARNFLAGPMFIFNMGHNPFSQQFLDTAKIAWNDFFKNETKFNGYIAKLVRLGVMHDNANSTEMRKTLEDFTETMGTTVVDTRGFMGKLKLANEKFQRAYQWGDDFWKIMAFEKEKADWLKQGLSEADAEAKAAYRVRNGMPTYSMVPRAFQILRRTPFVGSFVAFPYEVIRTTYRNIMFIQDDYLEGRTAMANKRFAGMAITSSLTFVLSKLTMQLFGLSEEDDEAIKLLGPDWSKNALFIYTGFDEKTGAPTFIDSSYTDPYSMFKKIINAVVTGNNMSVKEKFQSALHELTDPFIGTDIVAGALGEVIFNQKETGGSVYNDQDTAAGQLVSVVDHMRKALQPGIASNAERIGKSLLDIKTATGREYDLTDEMVALFGVRSITLDSGQALTYKGYSLNDELRDAQSLLSRAAADRNDVSPGKLESVFRSSMNARNNTYLRTIKMIEGMRTIGVEDREIRAALRAANFSVKNVNLLMRGQVPRWEMSSQFIETAAKRVRASSIPDKEKVEVLKEFNERKRLIRELAREYY